MAYDYLYLSTVPLEEACLQVGKASYAQMRAEARAYAQALSEYHGIPSDDVDVEIIVKQENHDFGTYPAVVVKYNEDEEAAVKLAFEIEADEPSTWEELDVDKPLPELDHLRG